jgi:hypothetical protein
MHFECVERLTAYRLKKRINGLKKNNHILPWLEKN